MKMSLFSYAIADDKFEEKNVTTLSRMRASATVQQLNKSNILPMEIVPFKLCDGHVSFIENQSHRVKLWR